MDYYIKIHDKQIPVSEEIYKAYCKGDRKERYFRESDIKNQTFFYDALDTEDLNGSDMFWDACAESVEETAERHLLLESLKKAAQELSENERELICRLYVYGESLRAYARSKKMPVTTLQARHQRLLKKLRKKLEKESYIRSV
ncbi:MAG: sigma-70 family RNA polymerase sigma factor [Lachnospiraceae bacterium]|jgi:RNA polymerase sigma factor (sigma-70 family)|nr:sigma-70 family RNA polymerase sigma factor [Lachnospiraceae bacterium]